MSSELGHKYILINGRKKYQSSVCQIQIISNVESRKVLKERTEEDGRKTFHLLYICPTNEPQVVERAALYQYT